MPAPKTHAREPNDGGRMGRRVIAHRPRARRSGALAAVAVFAGAVGFGALGQSAAGQEAAPAPLPNTFGLRLEGYAVEVNTFSTATAVTPRSAYSYAKISSSLDLDGGRGLDMEARGANGQYAGLEGAVLFSGDSPVDGNSLPGYAQAFFPTFEGFSTVSEKCVANQTEAKETPECRDQAGPYAFAQVVPDEAAPAAVGVGRNEGDDSGGDARSRSEIVPGEDGSIRGVQVNRGSDQRVPGTPIVVQSYVAEQSVAAVIGDASTEISCGGQVTVAGQPVNDNEALQEALAPLTIGSDLRVTYEPPSEPEVKELPGGALEATCRGPRFTVFTSGQGGTGTQYTFGRTLAAIGLTENREAFAGAGGGGGAIGDFPEPAGGGAPTGAGSSVAPPAATGSVSTGAPAASPDEQPTAPTSTVPIGSDEEASGPELVRRGVDALPIGALTAAGGAALALGVWLLLGVTGSLARGLPSLRLPPFPDG